MTEVGVKKNTEAFQELANKQINMQIKGRERKQTQLSTMGITRACF